MNNTLTKDKFNNSYYKSKYILKQSDNNTENIQKKIYHKQNTFNEKRRDNSIDLKSNNLKDNTKIKYSNTFNRVNDENKLLLPSINTNINNINLPSINNNNNTNANINIIYNINYKIDEYNKPITPKIRTIDSRTRQRKKVNAKIILNQNENNNDIL